MADIQPLRGVRFNTEIVNIGKALAPPYDVIDAALQERLYGRNLRNIVRIDYGTEYSDDVTRVNDRYTRAEQHLHSWLHLGVLQQDNEPSFYITDHQYTGTDGKTKVRRGIWCRVLAKPWEHSEVLPHERTMRGPKEDRLRLMQSLEMQTSPVFMVWKGKGQEVADTLSTICRQEPAWSAETRGVDAAVEGQILWRVENATDIAALQNALADAPLYMADGHHRFETAAAYAAQRRAEEPGAPDPADFDYALAYICDADSEGVELLPTHRLVKARADLPKSLAELTAKLGDGWNVVPTDDLDGAVRASGIRQPTHHAFAVRLGNESAMLARARTTQASPRDNLDVVVLEEGILKPLDVSADKGDLRFTRDIAEVEQAVSGGEASLGIVLNHMAVDEVLAVADAGQVMPQKSTYFYPKVPTGIVLSPLG